MGDSDLLLLGAAWRPKRFPAPPTRSQLLRGRCTQQGLIIHTTQFGDMPWWGACWAWLNAQSRREAAAQLQAHGDTLCLIELPCGPPLYNEPDQFYSADQFGPLDLTHGNTQIDPAFVALIEEAIGTLGFAGVYVFLGGDDGNRGGYQIAVQQTRLLGPALAASRKANLNQYTLQSPGWDGVWHKPNPGIGYSRAQVASFAVEARAAGAIYLGIEHGTGYLLAGEGAADFQPGGVLHGYNLVFGEFDDDTFDNTVWQILPRMGVAYVRPPAQDVWEAANCNKPPDFIQPDLHPPNYLAGTDVVYRIWEYFIYGSVRGVPVATIQAARQQFLNMGAEDALVS